MAKTVSSSEAPSPALITIPLEVRLNILENLFRSITVRHGFDSKGTTNTSILLVCKQLHEEASPLLPLHVLLHFRSPSAMLDVLTTLPKTTIEKIRHIQLKAFPFPLYSKPEQHYYITYGIDEVLRMLPGLQLDTLTLEDAFHDEDTHDSFADIGTYLDVDLLISEDGWKTLRYSSPSTKFMSSWRPHGSPLALQKQPEHWNQVIQAKDLGSSDASVKMYVAITPKVRGLTSNPITRTALEVDQAQVAAQATAELEEGRNDDREVLIVAKRGSGVNYVQDGTKLDKDIRALLEKMSWQELKASNRYINGELDPSAHL